MKGSGIAALLQTVSWDFEKFKEKSRAQGAIGFDFASHWLKNWHEFFKLIIKRWNRSRVITFDSHLLYVAMLSSWCEF